MQAAGDGSSYYSDPHVFPLADEAPQPQRRGHARVLLFSQRNVERPVWHGGMYEFEDILASIDDVRMLAPKRRTGSRALRLGRQLHSTARERFGLTRLLNSEPIRVDGHYDLFFAVFHFAWQVSYLHQLKEWRERSTKAVCFIIEQWLPEIDDVAPYVEMLESFDHVFVFSRWSIPPMRALSGTSVEYLPIGADALASCPYPAMPPRGIDVFSMGRRTSGAHQGFVRMMREERLSYVFDSVNAGRDLWVNHVEHRALIRHLLKRSRYFLAYRHNDSPAFRVRTGGEEAIPSRYFESIAGGPVVIGSVPRSDDFRALFDWPDAAIEVPDSKDEIESAILSLDAQPDRLVRARTLNVVNALRRHDWVYRWQRILRVAGLPEHRGTTSRVAALASLAMQVAQHGGAIADTLPPFV
jgi:hypothetical protein